MKWRNFVKQPPKESGRYFVKGCHLPGQFEWDGEYLIDWRGEPLEDIDEDIEYLDESPERVEGLEREGLKYVRGLFNEEDKDDKVLHNLIRIIPLVTEITAGELMPLCVIGFKPGETLAEPINVKFATCSKESDKILLVLCEELVKQYAPSSDPAEVLVKALKMIRDESGNYRNYQAGSIAAYALAEYEQLKQQG